MSTAAVVFEGGQPGGALQPLLGRLRDAVTLDTLAKLLAHADLAPVILGTDRPALAAAARKLGAEVWPTPAEGFHLGQVLQAICRRWRLQHVLVMGGASLPLLSADDLSLVAGLLHAGGPRVVVNNPQSADLVAFTPAAALDRIALPARDNSLGWLLREAGLQRVLLPSQTSFCFDLDTPTDFLILAVAGRAGPRAAAALAGVPWDRSRLLAARAVLQRPDAEVALLGRVGTHVVDTLGGRNVRARVVAEERGMKALGRRERGEVVSLVGALIDDLGAANLLAHLASVAGAVFFDTRVVFAHRGRRISRHDRFCSDLGRPEAIADATVRQLTAAALACAAPVVLGGHSVVAGGLLLLSEPAFAAPS